MPESTCLHIQDRESGPIRVVELPWISVRIGRAAYCEVRLPDAQIVDEACRLTRKGRTWSLIPSSGSGLITFEGRPLNGPCPLPFDVPFRLGTYCLTLRHDVAAEPDWELYPSTAPSRPEGSPRAAEPDLSRPIEGEPAVDEGTGATTAHPTEKASRSGADADRWRARWKAAEAHLKARAGRLDTGGPRPSYSTLPETSRETDRSPSGPPAMTPPPVGLPPRPTPGPSTPLIEPAWTTPLPDPGVAASRMGPTAWPSQGPATRRFEPSPPRPFEPRGNAPASTDSPSTRARRSDDLVPLPAAEDEAAGVVESDVPDGFPVGTETGHCSEPGAATVDPMAMLGLSPDDPGPAEVVSDSHGPVPAEPLETENETTKHPEEGPPDHECQIEPPPRDTETDRPKARARSSDASKARGSSGPSALGLATPGASRPIERGPRRRKPPRDRIGGKRGNDPSRRSRAERERMDSSGEHEASPAASIPELELPNVRDILANHRNSRGPRPAVERPRVGKQAIPTVPQEPGQWVLPGWLALPPVGLCGLGMGLVACVLSWWWARDASNAALITQRLMAPDPAGRGRPLPDDFTPPGGRWIRTTAQHLAHWGIYIADAEMDEAHPAREAPMLLGQALEISPLNPTARLAMAQLEEPGRDDSGRIRGLGLSRDSVSLAWSARRLMDAGKKQAALRLYSRAISAAVDGGLSRSATPRFSEDTAVHRYFLPGEDAVRDVVAELAAREGLEFREWSGALPRNPIVLLATARLLREQGRTEAEELLDELLAERGGGPEEGQRDPRLLAARAEALMLRSRWAEAAEQYRQAIERVDNDLIRRSWWFNLADIVKDEGQRQAAVRAALAVASSDDITRRASQIQKSGGTKVRSRYGYGSARAN